jgi:hypothetical protein
MTNQSSDPQITAHASETAKVTRELESELALPHNGVTNLRAVVQALIKSAINGSVPAISEIFNRIDGKVPPQPVPRDCAPSAVIVRWQSDEESQ